MKKVFALTLAMLMMAGMACSTVTDLISDEGDIGSGENGGTQVGQTEEPAPDQSGESGSVLFSDDFSDPSSGWERGDYETGTVGYESGVYSVVSNGDGETMWGIANRNFGDVIIEVQATQLDAPDNDNNDYGVMCRVQDNNEGYFLLISGDGFYSILLRAEDSFTPLVDWTSSEAFNLGNATNQIQATCDGDTFTLTVNGTELASATDSTFSNGDIALTATSYEAAATEVHFDNLEVRAP